MCVCVCVCVSHHGVGSRPPAGALPPAASPRPPPAPPPSVHMRVAIAYAHRGHAYQDVIGCVYGHR
eukprot:2866968-Rhodomonas_salina.1